MFRLLRDFQRPLAAVGLGVCFLPAWLGLLCLCFGFGGVFWFMCSWMFVALMGSLIGLIVLPEPRISR